MFNSTKFVKAALLAVVGFLPLTSHAALLTTNTLLGANVIDFSNQATRNDDLTSVQIGQLVGQDVQVQSSSNSNGLYFNYSGWGMADNGNWGGGRTYVSLNGSNDSMLFSFNSGLVSAVGGQMSYAKYSGSPDLIISVFDINMVLLESYDLTTAADIIQPGFNGSEFRGIQRTTSDIAFFSISAGLANAIDDLTFVGGGQQVPEPGVLVLFGLGLFGFVIARRRKS